MSAAPEALTMVRAHDGDMFDDEEGGPMTPQPEKVVRRMPAVIDHWTYCFYCRRSVAKWERGDIVIIETTVDHPQTGYFRAGTAHTACR